MSMFRGNPILNTDSYKASHYLQSPPSTTNISSYIQSRGGDYDETVLFGPQAWIKTYVEGTKVTYGDVLDAEKFWAAHGLPFNKEGWLRIVNHWGGHYPIEIEAVDEGTVLPTGNVLLQIRNTDPELPWVTSYLETSLLRGIWYPTTVATRSRHIKKIIKRYLDETADNADGLMFKLHDFGARGVSSYESAILGGMAHLVNFMGSDTTVAIEAARHFYNEDMAGYSIPAAEHSTITAWGEENEAKAYANMIDKFGGPGKLVAVVSDSYDIYNAARNIWGKELKEKVKSFGGTLVVRPDSGNPASTVLGVLNILGERFGTTINGKGYAMLPPYLRVIQGDGVNEHSINDILNVLKVKGWSADNVAFGMGGELLQTVNRDTLKFAMKANAISSDGGTSWKDVYKKPVGDASKASKAGRLMLVKTQKGYETRKADRLFEGENLLKTRLHNHQILNPTTFAEIRKRAAL